jgi:prolyl oligopeptidase
MVEVHKKKTSRALVRPLIGLCVLAMAGLSTPTAFVQSPKAPASRTDNVREVIHGVEIIDPYRWLENQDSPETRQWIDTQNKYTRSVLEGLPSRRSIQKRLTELLRVDTVSAPVERGGRYFLYKKRAEDDLSILVDTLCSPGTERQR